MSCIEHQGWKKPTGYGQTLLNGVRMHAHRAAWIREHGAIPSGMVVMHKCDNPSCVNLDHLKLGTQKENMQDAVSKGRMGKTVGSIHGSAKLSETDIPMIRSLPWRQVDIAAAYGITQQVVSKIRNRRLWSHVS